MPVEKTIIDRCVRLVYRNYLNDPRPENMPILGDLYEELRKQDEKEAQYIATALEIYVTGSFDCSGFVSYVYNNCDLGWNFGRLGAEGLRQTCAYVSPANARPGDLIFFQGTYDTTGASHVGIYVGNNTMLHCGDPIQYSDITSSYWQQHFYQFGRLPSP